MDTQDSAAPAVRKAPRQAKPKGPAGLTVTLAYTEGEWMVGATQGSRALAKPYVIKPAEALKFVALLDVPGVHEAVEQIIASERDQAPPAPPARRPPVSWGCAARRCACGTPSTSSPGRAARSG